MNRWRRTAERSPARGLQRSGTEWAASAGLRLDHRQLALQHLDDLFEVAAGFDLAVAGEEHVVGLLVAAQQDFGHGEDRLFLAALEDREDRHVGAVVDGVIAPDAAGDL